LETIVIFQCVKVAALFICCLLLWAVGFNYSNRTFNYLSSSLNSFLCSVHIVYFHIYYLFLILKYLLSIPNIKLINALMRSFLTIMIFPYSPGLLGYRFWLLATMKMDQACKSTDTLFSIVCACLVWLVVLISNDCYITQV